MTADNAKEVREDLTIEESLKELDGIVERLESREISLEDSFSIYQKGMELLRQCSSKIDTVEKKMLKINENGEFSEF
nr:exodeoxyribonuclease VII small subunit [uncultured Blautia sp.]